MYGPEIEKMNDERVKLFKRGMIFSVLAFAYLTLCIFLWVFEKVTLLLLVFVTVPALLAAFYLYQSVKISQKMFKMIQDQTFNQ